MPKREPTDLEDSQNWDMDNVVKSGPVKNRRTVVSVSFPSSAFQVVSAAAGEAGLSTSQFIREAAIAKASPYYAEVVVKWAGATSAVVAPFEPSYSTFAQTPIIEPHIEYKSEGAFVYTPA